MLLLCRNIFAVLIFLFCSSIDVGGGDHFGGADPDAAPLDDGEVLHHHQYHPHFYFPVYWFRLQVMVNNIIATAGLIEVIGLELFWTGTESVMEDQDACTMCTSQTLSYRVGDEKMSFTRCFLRVMQNFTRSTSRRKHY